MVRIMNVLVGPMPVGSRNDADSIRRPRQPGLAAALRQRAHPADIGGPLGDADDAARVEQVEQVARLDALVIGGQRAAAAPAAPRIRSRRRRNGANSIAGVGVLEIIGGEFALGAQEHVAVASTPGAVEVEVVDALDALHVHRQPFQPVGHLEARIGHVDAADLLEIGELADLHPVEPDLPAEPPGAQRRAFPIVLDEADVVRERIDADRRDSSPEAAPALSAGPASG